MMPEKAAAFRHVLPASRLGTSLDSLDDYRKAISPSTKLKHYTLVIVTEAPARIVLRVKTARLWTRHVPFLWWKTRTRGSMWRGYTIRPSRNSRKPLPLLKLYSPFSEKIWRRTTSLRMHSICSHDSSRIQASMITTSRISGSTWKNQMKSLRDILRQCGTRRWFLRRRFLNRQCLLFLLPLCYPSSWHLSLDSVLLTFGNVTVMVINESSSSRGIAVCPSK